LLEIKQEVVVQGRDKVFKDVIEPLESVSVNLMPTTKQDIRELGSPQEVSSQFFFFTRSVFISFEHCQMVQTVHKSFWALTLQVIDTNDSGY
jgi:PsbP